MPNDFQAIAERINTGAENPETSRALVVFNSTFQSLSGMAVFRASYSWPRNLPLPPVVVTDSDGAVVLSALQEQREAADEKSRADRMQLSFALCFAVCDVPAQGWRTYIASYTEAPMLTQKDDREDFVETPGLVVVETMRHDGALPMQGRF